MKKNGIDGSHHRFTHVYLLLPPCICLPVCPPHSVSIVMKPYQLATHQNISRCFSLYFSDFTSKMTAMAPIWIFCRNFVVIIADFQNGWICMKFRTHIPLDVQTHFGSFSPSSKIVDGHHVSHFDFLSKFCPNFSSITESDRAIVFPLLAYLEYGPIFFSF